MSNKIFKENFLLITFAILLLFLFYGGPFLFTLLSSFKSNAELGQEGGFVGLSNYVAVWSNLTYWYALSASAAFTLTAVIFQVGFAFAAALATRKNLRLIGFLRWILIIPYFLPSVVVVVAWRFFTDPFVGPLPAIFHLFGFESPDFRGPETALSTMVLVATYEAFPFTYVVLLARLMQIPRPLYEVAQLDGAGMRKSFFMVTWPQIRLTLFGLVVLRILITWLKFDVPWLVYAHRAPSRWGDTLGIVIHRTAFENLQFGKACSFSVSLISFALLAFAVYWLMVKANKAKVY